MNASKSSQRECFASADLRVGRVGYIPDLEDHMKVKKAVLVYQAGIANVFAVDSFNMADYGRNAKRLLQDAFGPCEWYARGLAYAGIKVCSMHCNQAGDIMAAKWSDNLEDAPFFDKMCPVYSMTA